MAGFNAAYTEYVEPLREALKWYASEDVVAMGTTIPRSNMLARTTLAKLGLVGGGKDE